MSSLSFLMNIFFANKEIVDKFVKMKFTPQL